MLSRQSIIVASSLLGSTTAFYGSGMFFAASHMTIPILFPLPAKTAASVFEDFFYRGAKTQVPLAVFSTLCTIVASAMDPTRRARYAVASVLTAGSMAWTGVVMTGTNKRLLKLAKEDAKDEEISEEVEQLLKTWKWMNLVRAGFGLAGGAVGLATILRFRF